MGHFEDILAAKFSTSSGDFATVSGIYLIQARLCDRLETIADELPRIDQSKLDSAKKALEATLPTLMQVEEDVILPLLVECCSTRDRMDDLSGLIRREHAEDTDRAYELCELLTQLAGRHIAPEAEMMGFCLRAFFDTLGRHLAWECHCIMPLLVDDAVGPKRLESQLVGRIDLTKYAL